MATLVKFVKDHNFEGNNIVAYFPQLNYCKPLYGNNMKTTYAHIGQHGPASVEWLLQDTTPATPTEYQALKNELESIGYNLKICKS